MSLPTILETFSLKYSHTVVRRRLAESAGRVPRMLDDKMTAQQPPDNPNSATRAGGAPRSQSALRHWLPLPVMGLAIVIVVLDTTLLNVSLATIVEELDTDLRSIQWVISAYSLTLASLTITGGRLGDIFGRKRMFVAGAIVFAIGSFVASISTDVTMLIWGESIIEGIGAAMMLPATVSLLVTHYRGRERAMAMGIWGGMAALGAAVGPVVGGYLTTNHSWRWGFRINVFVAAALVLASFAIKDRAPRAKDARLDWVGALLSAGGLFFGVFAIIEGAEYGWWTAVRDMTVGGLTLNPGSLSVVPVAVGLSVLMLVGFVLWERRMTRRLLMPLLPPGLFAVDQFRNGVLLTGTMALGQMGLLFSLPVFLQGVRGLDALRTGYALLPISAGLLVTAPLGGYLSRRVPPARIVRFGLVLSGTGLLILYLILSTQTTSRQMMLPLALYGLGLGFCFSQLANITLSAVEPRLTGAAAGVNNTVRQVGSSLGVAVIGTIVLVSLTAGLRAGIGDSGLFSVDERAAMAHSVSGDSVFEFTGDFDSAVSLSGAQREEVRTIARQSTVEAGRRAFLFTLGTIVAAFLLALGLPKGLDLEAGHVPGKPVPAPVAPEPAPAALVVAVPPEIETASGRRPT